MEIIIHVGPHKTASSLLQRAFLSEKDHLLKNNILYPTELIPTNLFGQHLIGRGLRQKNTDLVSSYFKSLNKPHEKLLLSSENLAELNINQLENLKTLLPPSQKISIVYFIRSLSGLIPSRWQETVKQGKFHSFETFYLEHLASIVKSNILNYSRNLDRLAKVFGKENINLISYNKLIHDGNDIVRFVFENVIKLKNEGSYNKVINPSLNTYQIEILRGLNLIHHREGHLLSNDIRKTLFKLIRTENWEAPKEIKLILDECFKSISLNDSSLPLSISWQRLTTKYEKNFVYQKVLDLKDLNEEKELLFASDLIFTNNEYFCFLNNLYNTKLKIPPKNDSNRS